MEDSGDLYAVGQGLARQVLGMSPISVGSSVIVQSGTGLSTWQPQGPKPGAPYSSHLAQMNTLR